MQIDSVQLIHSCIVVQLELVDIQSWSRDINERDIKEEVICSFVWKMVFPPYLSSRIEIRNRPDGHHQKSIVAKVQVSTVFPPSDANLASY